MSPSKAGNRAAYGGFLTVAGLMIAASTHGGFRIGGLITMAVGIVVTVLALAKAAGGR